MWARYPSVSYHQWVWAAAGSRALGCAFVVGDTPGRGSASKSHLSHPRPTAGKWGGSGTSHEALQAAWGAGMSLRPGPHHWFLWRSFPMTAEGLHVLQPTQAKAHPDSPGTMVSYEKDANLSCK